MIRRFRINLALMLALGAGTSARADIIDYTYTLASNIESRGEEGSLDNVVIELDLATILGINPEFEIIGGGYNVRLLTNSGGSSWLSEMYVGINDTNYWRPGSSANRSGGPTNFSVPVTPFSSAGRPNISVTDGILQLRFFESFDDFVDPDGYWLAGSTLTFRLNATALAAVPEPSTIGLALSGLVGIGGYGAWQRRRRIAAA